MKKKFIITTEEFEAIEQAIESVLQLWHYDFITVKTDYDGGEMHLSKKTFFDSLKNEFIIKGYDY